MQVHLIDLGLVCNQGIDPMKIAVLTPFAAQREAIRNEHGKKGGDPVFIMSIEECQGKIHCIVFLILSYSLPDLVFFSFELVF